jgi:two-component system, response regulator PdtaR
MTHTIKLHTSPVVLVVEDDGLIRSFATNAFEDAGFVVFEATSANRALVILAVSARHIDAMFTDIQMPGGMNGVLLALHTRRQWPWIRLALTSGQAHPSASALPENTPFFSKPYDIDHVVEHFLSETLAAV